MKKHMLFLAMIALGVGLHAQNHYWVMLTDKAGTSFDPYTYFDTKAIERYHLNEANLYDVSNYPLTESYVNQIDALVTDDFGQSRWLNAVAVTATPDQIEAVAQLPFVREVVALNGRMETAHHHELNLEETLAKMETEKEALHKQLQRMGGKYFRAKGFNGKGIRIAVLDGGFPQVNTHIAFLHLRNNRQIIKTYNFPNKKEDVYGWNSHGLMTLSCIAARYDSIDLGLATGAEFLLARTEIADEPFKEEVWWQMGMEWADKNGAQIISSSLGYGKDRYYTRDMNGQSYVAKAANMAARKGILVCNSAGNEGDDDSWRTIITPADADSVLCVGGINPSLTNYERTSFSSYGPSADGRQKPNVCAFAYAWTANTGNSNSAYRQVPGTSFSCPLVAGFAACALQSHPDLKAMQLLHEIEKSADLYPYCDYSFGYGVPQADYFTGDRKPVKPTFKLEKTNEGVRIIPLKDNLEACRLFVKNCRADGSIIDYDKIELSQFTQATELTVSSAESLTVHYNGYTESIKASEGNAQTSPLEDNSMVITIQGDNVTKNETHKMHFSNYLDEKNRRWEFFVSIGLPLNTESAEMDHNFWSPNTRLGFRRTYYLKKAYGLGWALNWGITAYNLGKNIGSVDQLLTFDVLANNMFSKLKRHKIEISDLELELYQRVRLRPGGIFHKGWHWDLGIYGNWMCYNNYMISGTYKNAGAAKADLVMRNLDALSDSRFNFGVTTRISRDWLGLYARYRLNGLGKTVAAGQLLLPRLEVGLQMAF